MKGNSGSDKYETVALVRLRSAAQINSMLPTQASFLAGNSSAQGGAGNAPAEPGRETESLLPGAADG
jgi:hypothetical protein